MFGDRIGKIFAGRPIPARPLGALARLADRLTRLRAGAGLSSSWDVVPNLRDREEGRFWALLSGSTSPYSITEQIDTTAGGFSTLTNGRTCTNCAYEANAQTGLGGKYVEVKPGPVVGEYRFRYNRWSTQPPCHTPGFTICCVQCSETAPNAIAGISGVLCTLKNSGGTTVGTCTTGANGCCSIVFGGNDTFTASATYNGVTLTCTRVCNGCNNATATLAFGGGGVANCINGVASTGGCPPPTAWPSTLTLATPAGNVTLTKFGTPLTAGPLFTYYYWGCQTVTVSGWQNPYCPNCALTGTTGSTTVPVAWLLGTTSSAGGPCDLFLKGCWPTNGYDDQPQPNCLCYNSSNSIITDTIVCNTGILVISTPNSCNANAGAGCWTFDFPPSILPCCAQACCSGFGPVLTCYPINVSVPMTCASSIVFGASWTATITP